MSESKDYYALLGVSQDASEAEITAAYRTGAKTLHPDKPGGDAEKYIEFQKAYEVLKDSKKRALYDRYGAEGMEEASKFQHMHESDAVDAADDVKVNLEVTLADLYSGASKEVEITRTKICANCDGLGAPENADRKTCTQCDGRGRLLVNYGFIQTMIGCDECEGKGKVIANEEDKCDECHGEGTSKETKKITIPLSKDMRYGGIKIPGEGNQVRDHISGGCIVMIRPPAKEPSEMKLLNQNDLFLLKDVPLVDALLGIKFLLNHVSGEELGLEVDSKSIVSTGDLYKLKGLGMPKEEGNYQKRQSKGEKCPFDNLLDISEEQRGFLIQALGKPTEIPEGKETKKLEIEKTAEDMQKEGESEDERERRAAESDDERGHGQPSCVQQ